MYKHDDGTRLVGYGCVFCIIGPQFVGSYEGEPYHDNHPEGLCNGE